MRNGNWIFKNKQSFAISMLFISCITAVAFIFDTTAGVSCCSIWPSTLAQIYVEEYKKKLLSNNFCCAGWRMAYACVSMQNRHTYTP